MKVFKLTIIWIIVLFFIQSCDDKKKADTNLPRFKTASSEVMPAGDTINRTYDGLKHGRWVEFKSVVVSNTIYSTYGLDTVTYKTYTKNTKRYATEEGVYIDNKKEGIWKYYFPDGRVKATVNYKKDVAQ